MRYGFNPWSEKIPHAADKTHAPQLLSLCSRAWEPQLRSPCATSTEGCARSSLCSAARVQGKGARSCPALCDPMYYTVSRPEYWSGLPFPSPGDLPNLGIEPRSPALQEDALPTEPPQLEACALQPESSPCFLQPEKSLCSKENPVQPKLNQ